MKSYRFIIKGRVQGVYYRKSVYEAAVKEGFKGYVRNLSDGSVEAACSCDEDRLDEFIEILHRGSFASIVNSIDRYVIDETFDKFEIRY